MHGFDSLPTVIFLLVVMVTASPVQGRNLIHVDDNYALRMLKVHAQACTRIAFVPTACRYRHVTDFTAHTVPKLF